MSDFAETPTYYCTYNNYVASEALLFQAYTRRGLHIQNREWLNVPDFRFLKQHIFGAIKHNSQMEATNYRAHHGRIASKRANHAPATRARNAIIINIYTLNRSTNIKLKSCLSPIAVRWANERKRVRWRAICTTERGPNAVFPARYRATGEIGSFPDFDKSTHTHTHTCAEVICSIIISNKRKILLEHGTSFRKHMTNSMAPMFCPRLTVQVRKRGWENGSKSRRFH